MPHSNWTGKTVVICGASAGLGRALVRELASQGVGELWLLARRAEPLQQEAEYLAGKYPQIRVQWRTVDLAERAAVAAVADEFLPSTRQIDLLIQAVGRSDRGEISQLSTERLNDLFEINVISSLHALQCFLPVLKQPGGAIVLIGSLASRFAPRYLGGYAIAKHALAALAQQSRLELAERGVHVMLACPGPIARDDAGERYAEVGQDLPDEARRPGGGARLTGLDPQRVSAEILHAAARRQPDLMRPRKTRLLAIASAFSSRLGDLLLRKNSS